ncbi:MAG: hypothetical protein IJ920_09075, partial [Paludibacteraceae bacterium]|nr:hypothetical protein [Paludibacteraceae bacterium]
MELPKFTYIYNMVDNAGNIAIKGTASQTIFSPLTKASIPSTIFSPYLADETVTFYSTFTEGSRSNLSGAIIELPATNNADIYVSYTTANLSKKSINLSDKQQFNVQLNGEFIYWDGTKVLSKSTGYDLDDSTFLWRLEGLDPYAMKVLNVKQDKQTNKYVKVADGTWGDDKALVMDSEGNASRFIAMLSNYEGIYEVMAATGTTDYYHIGRPSSENAEVKIYSEATYPHGADQLRFILSNKEPIRYTLIDMNGDSLLTVSSNNARLTLPAEVVSPLVGTYYYYPTKAKAVTNNTAEAISELSDDTYENGTQTDSHGDYHVWVRYTVNDVIGFNNTGRVNDHPYLLKFLDPLAAGYYLEDGADKLTTTQIQAIYPYCNGDGNLNIYGEIMRDEQMGGGSSTRPRWVWFFESANNDPYHVRIHSRSTISYNGVSHPTYLETKAVHFNQDASASTLHIVTGGSFPGIAATTPTEYMILGLPGAFKLVTTKEINDGTTTERRTVNSFEQYWKTYNMLKLHVLGISATTDAYSTDNTTWVVPTDPASYRTTIAAKGWHSYDAYANATRWNGYNDKESGHEKKVVEKLEHWFQTFDMGNGTFDIEDADIPPVLVLLDRHGWEIMRKPLPVDNYPLGEDELAALRVYDSPLVDKYYFYSNATKATGCHKYTLRLDDKGNERDQITVNGAHYSSTSLGSLPPANAKGVKSSGVLNDQFVIYTVKEEYEMSYEYNFTDNGNNTYTESGTPSKFLILQNSRFARDNDGSGDRISYLSKPITEASKPVGGNVYDMIMSPQTETEANVSTDVDEDNDGNIDDKNLWYIQPNLNIDKEMGIKWASVSGGTSEPMTEYETKKAYKDKTGFDPYNMQLQNVGNSKYLTAHMTSTKLDNGIMIGDYSGGGSDGITFEDWVDVKNVDTSTPKMIDDKLVDEG